LTRIVTTAQNRLPRFGKFDRRRAILLGIPAHVAGPKKTFAGISPGILLGFGEFQGEIAEVWHGVGTLVA